VKFMLEKLTKESEEKEAYINLQEEKCQPDQEAREAPNLICHQRLKK